MQILNRGVAQSSHLFRNVLLLSKIPIRSRIDCSTIEWKNTPFDAIYKLENFRHNVQILFNSSAFSPRFCTIRLGSLPPTLPISPFHSLVDFRFLLPAFPRVFDDPTFPSMPGLSSWSSFYVRFPLRGQTTNRPSGLYAI